MKGFSGWLRRLLAVLTTVARVLSLFWSKELIKRVSMTAEASTMTAHAIHGHEVGECKAIEVANAFIHLGRRDKQPVSNMALQKLLYYTYGWYLAYYNERAFEEAIQAWKYGPVVKSVYHASKRYGTEPIPELLSVVEYDDSGNPFEKPKVHTPELPGSDRSLQVFIESIWSAYGKLSPMDLVKMTHVEGGPWHRVWLECKGDIPLNTSIPDSYIKDYFNRLIKK